MHQVCRLITPASMVFTFGSSLANCICGNTWAEESRNHMACMSPVSTKVSGLPFTTLCSQVVSNVLGKQFSNIQASFGSFSIALVVAIAFSTAADVNCRFSGAGRLHTYCMAEAVPIAPFSVFPARRANEFCPTIRPASERPPVFRKFLRVVILFAIYLMLLISEKSSTMQALSKSHLCSLVLTPVQSLSRKPFVSRV